MQITLRYASPKSVLAAAVSHAYTDCQTYVSENTEMNVLATVKVLRKYTVKEVDFVIT